MAGSTLGNIFRVTTWGESHGPGIGVVVDGCPAGLELTVGEIQEYLNRRKPGQGRYTTARQEGDVVSILSGVFEGRTTGTPISLMVMNMDQRSRDYSNIRDIYRPGHADYGFDSKYGCRDYRGGGRSSGRETIGRVAAGAVAVCLLRRLGVRVQAYTKSIGPVEISPGRFDMEERDRNQLFMPDPEAAARAREFLDRMIEEKESAGGVVECAISGLPAGLGDPVFEKLDANLARAVLSIGAVKGFEVGDGFAAAASKGSVNNDAFFADEDGNIGKRTNHAGGILGGISDGSPIVFRAAFKPTPSVAVKQQTVNRGGENVEIEIKGRHDPVIVPRAVVVVEAMAALAAADAMLMGMTARMDWVESFYKERKGE